MVSALRPVFMRRIRVWGGAPSAVGRHAAACVAAFLLTVAASVRAQVRIDVERPAMGTAFRIVACAPDSLVGMRAVEAGFARVRALERVLSDYDPDSEVSRLASAPPGRRTAVSGDLAGALAVADSWWRRTDGAFDAALGALTRTWRRAMRRGEVPGAAEVERARIRSGWHLVDRSRDGRSVAFLEEGVRLDFGGIGKGLAAEEALAALRAQGVSRAVVDAGGDVVAGNPPPDAAGWLVDGPGRRRWLLARGAVATSGDRWRHVEADSVRYSHILDPRTGYGVTGRRVVTVFAGRGTDADALASALSVPAVDRAVELARREATGAILEGDEGVSPWRVVVGSLPEPAPPGARPTECRVDPTG